MRKPASERFKIGDIIRYASGVSALFRYEGPVNVGRLYGTHVLGGAIGASDQLFFELRPASAEDIAFCKTMRPEWFAEETAADDPRIAGAKCITAAVLDTLKAGGDNLAIYQAVLGALPVPSLCPNCKGTKRALYFSEPAMTHEERDCHVCRGQR